MPYQVFGLSVGALALTMAWIRSAMTRSGFGISAILASTSLSPSTLPERARRRSLRVSLMAATSSADNNVSDLPELRRTDVCVVFFLLMGSLLNAGHQGLGTLYPRVLGHRLGGRGRALAQASVIGFGAPDPCRRRGLSAAVAHTNGARAGIRTPNLGIKRLRAPSVRECLREGVN